MTVLKYIVLRLIPAAVLAGAMLLTSCIKDNRDDCIDEPQRFMLYVKITDTETGRDITSTADVREAILAVFDREGYYVASRVFDREEVATRTPWILTDIDMQGMHVSAWADLGDGIEISDPAASEAGSTFVKLPVDDGGFSPSPDDFFFGLHTIGPALSRSTHTQEVVLTQKNAKVHVTVKGLQSPVADDYYFVIETPGNGYDTYGKPTNQRAYLRHTGRINAAGNLVSPEPYLAIHSADPDNPGPDDGAVVVLYRRDDGGDTPLAVAKFTDTGRYIGLYPGKTTNILIDLGDPASLEIRVEVTGWRQVYQWDQW